MNVARRCSSLVAASAPIAALAGLVAACAACSTAPAPSRASAPPPIFGGQGAVVGPPKEQPLAAAPEGRRAPAGPCGEPSPPSDVALLDDFEDGDQAAFHGFQREGWWFSGSDATEGAKLSPPRGAFMPERLPAAEGRKDDIFAAHLKAEGQKDWGVVWGVSLRYASRGIRCPLNLSAFAGLHFRAKGPATVKVSFGIPETQPAEGGGTCTSGCYDSHSKMVFLSDRWDDYVVPWNRLEQGGWGAEARFDSSRVISLQFGVKPADLPVDLWVDDLNFVSAAEAEALAAADRARPAPAPQIKPVPAPAPASGHLAKPL